MPQPNYDRPNRPLFVGGQQMVPKIFMSTEAAEVMVRTMWRGLRINDRATMPLNSKHKPNWQRWARALNEIPEIPQ